MARKKTVIIDPKAQINPNGSIQGANNILYQDFDAVDCLYNSLAEYFTTGKVSGTSHLGKIIQKDFDIIEKGLKNGYPDLRDLKDLMDILVKFRNTVTTRKQWTRTLSSICYERTCLNGKRTYSMTTVKR